MNSLAFSFFSITGWGIGLDHCEIEWFALEMNKDHSVVFETASKYCILDSFVDRDGYSNSSKDHEYSLEGLRLKLKLQYFGQLM